MATCNVKCSPVKLVMLWVVFVCFGGARGHLALQGCTETPLHISKLSNPMATASCGYWTLECG